MNANDSEANSHSISRRNFLAVSAAIPAALLAQTPLTAKAEDTPAAAKKIPLGLELYSVRDELGRDLPKTLKTVAGDGYEVVEFYAPYYDWSPTYAKEVRALMDDLGIRCYSTHNSFTSFTPDGMGKAIELNQILGTRTLVCASAGAKGLDGWKHLGEQLTEAVEKLKPHGLSAGFHNHDAEWAPIDGDKRIMDVLAANTPKEFVLQLDVGTCVKAGADPVAWINANPGRIHSLHLKDWSPSGSYEVLFGEGVCPWKEIMAAAESVGGVEYYLVEQEGSRYSEFETVQRCLAALKKMRGMS